MPTPEELAMTHEEIQAEMKRLMALLPPEDVVKVRAELERRAQLDALPAPPTEPIIVEVLMAPGSTFEASQMYRYGMDQELDTLPEGSELRVTVAWATDTTRLKVEGMDSKVACLSRAGATLAAAKTKDLAPMARSRAGKVGYLGTPLELTADHRDEKGEGIPLVIKDPPKGLKVWVE
jgi:hypothetical protein